MVVGAPQQSLDTHGAAGYIRVYWWDGNGWLQLGQDLIGVGSSDEFGDSLSLSGDGQIFSVGSPYYNDDTGMDAGKVRVFHFNINRNQWEPLGLAIVRTPGDAFSEVAISEDGRTLVVGVPDTSLNGNIEVGPICIFSFDGNDWKSCGPFWRAVV